jgi:hypothetical protein
MHVAPLLRRLRWLCLPLLLAAAPSARACTIPVFRYALERWELSPYEVLVFHRGTLPAKTRSFLSALPGKANISITPIELDGTLSAEQQLLWQRHGQPQSLPWAIVRRTEAGAKAAPVWTGPCEPARLRPLVDSPTRQQAIAALGQGKSVFVLLLSGDDSADMAAEKLLRGQLAKLEKLVKLPEQSREGPRIRLALPLAVGFTVLPLKRDEPAEEAFVRILMGAEPGLDKVRGPIAFPIFGRGRLLGCLHGAELDADNLFEVVSFLCGECSCQVKELNPGMDLPIAADWPAIFARIGPAPDSGPEPPPGTNRIAAHAKPSPNAELAGSSKPDATMPSDVRAAVSAYPPETNGGVPTALPEASHRRWLWLATGGAAVLVLFTGAWAWVQWRTRL